MKIRKIIIVVLFSVLVISGQKSNIQAEEEIMYETLPQIQRSSVSYDESTLQRDVELYLKNKYGTQNWNKGEHNTTEIVSNGIPIEMQGENHYEESVIKEICSELGLKTTYGGCGPIAMIGMADFFARYLGYTEIIENPNDVEQQKELIREFLDKELMPTMEVNDPDGDGKQTLTFPWDCANGFNQIMKNHHLENTIQAINMGFFGISKNEKIAKIKEQIDIGLPVTVYTALAGNGYLGNHYVNVYGYEDWHGVDQNGNSITHTMLLFRMNWGKDYNDTLYMDSDILGSLITGVIYYEITYQYQCLPSMLFMGLKNENNQGEYLNEEVEKTISISEYEMDMTFITRRVRCSYLEQGYLVLSANRDNYDSAYLELEFEKEVRQIGLNLSLWSHNEQFSNNTTLRLEYFDSDENKWKIGKEINVLLLKLKEEPSKTNLTILPKGSTKIRIIVENKGITTDRNKGRIVINHIDIYIDTQNQVYRPHEHRFEDRFVYIDEFSHWAYCECGIGIEVTHIGIEGNDNCLCCGGKVHTHEYRYEEDSKTHHLKKCICGEEMVEEHSFTYSYEGIDKDYHQVYCICGEFQQQPHIEYNDRGNIRCLLCDYLIEEHQHSYSLEYYNKNGHKKTCECGATTGNILAHAIIGTTIENGRYAKCIGCQALLDLNSDKAIVRAKRQNNRIVSDNGSYILANGIIILDEKDIESYMNGSLVFYLENTTME